MNTPLQDHVDLLSEEKPTETFFFVVFSRHDKIQQAEYHNPIRGVIGTGNGLEPSKRSTEYVSFAYARPCTEGRRMTGQMGWVEPANSG